MLISQGVKIEGGLSYDGIVSLFIGIIAVFAATVILPVMIQPLFDKQKSFSSITHENILVIQATIDEVLNIITDLNLSGKTVSERDRKTILSTYSKIANYCKIIVNHASESSALNDFDEKVATPLTGSRSNFSDEILPGVIISDEIYLRQKETLESAVYELIEYRHKLG